MPRWNAWLADKINEERVKEYQTANTTLANTLRTLFKIIVGQCSESVHGRIVDVTDYTTKKSTGDCVWLLNRIQKVVTNLEESQEKYLSFVFALKNLLNVVQNNKKGTHSNESYIQSICTNFRTIVSLGGIKFDHHFDSTAIGTTNDENTNLCKTSSLQPSRSTTPTPADSRR